MSDANAQRASTMIPIAAMRQPSEPHVRHAETEGCLNRYNTPPITTASVALC